MEKTSISFSVLGGQVLLELIFKYLIEKENCRGGRDILKKDHKWSETQIIWESSMKYTLMDQGADAKLRKSEDWPSYLYAQSLLSISLCWMWTHLPFFPKKSKI